MSMTGPSLTGLRGTKIYPCQPFLFKSSDNHLMIKSLHQDALVFPSKNDIQLVNQYFFLWPSLYLKKRNLKESNLLLAPLGISKNDNIKIGKHVRSN
jgi:hypothetical protein